LTLESRTLRECLVLPSPIRRSAQNI